MNLIKLKKNGYLLFYKKENDKNCNIYNKMNLNKLLESFSKSVLEEDNNIKDENVYKASIIKTL